MKSTSPEIPIGGKLLAARDVARDLGCSVRSADRLFETGEIKSFRQGRRKVTTEAERDRYIQSLIDAEIVRLKEAVG